MDVFVETKLNESLAALNRAIQEDVAYTESKVVPHDVVFHKLSNNYIRYIIAGNQLMDIHSYVIHPNKWPFLRDVIEKFLGRIIEIKHELVRLEKSDFQYLSNKIIANLITPRGARLLIPTYFHKEREPFFQDLYVKAEDILEEKAERERKEAEERARLEKEKQGQRFSELFSRSLSFQQNRASEVVFEGNPPEKTEEVTEPSDAKQVNKGAPSTTNILRPVVNTANAKEEYVFKHLEEVLLIQKHERARIFRLLLQQEKDKLLLEELKAWRLKNPILPEIEERAVMIIQRAWRKYRRERKRKYLQTQNRIIYGTYTPAYRKPPIINELKRKLEDHREDLKKRMEEAIFRINQDLETNEREEIKAEMVDDMRDYIFMWYQYTKRVGYAELPDWPHDDCLDPLDAIFGIPVGLTKDYIKNNFPKMKFKIIGKEPEPLCGSELISAGLWIPVEKYAPAAAELRLKDKPKEALDERERIEREKAEAAEKAEQEKEEEEAKLAELRKLGHIPEKSYFLPELHQMYIDYISDFLPGRDLLCNPLQEYEEERLKQDKVYQMRREMRKEVDAIIREDLDVLQNALNKDENRKPMERKKPKPRPEKKPKKKKKGPLDDQPFDSIFANLVEDGFVIKPEDVDILSLTGCYNYHATEAREAWIESLPTLPDVYQVANEYITIPLGSKEIKEMTPPVKSVLFAGNRRYTVPLVHAIVKASGSFMLYLRPINFESRYSTKMLINALLKVAREYEPTILFAESIDMAFLKKKPPAEEGKVYGGVRPVLGKLLKGIKNSDRIVLIGTAETPWLCKAGMGKLFQKVLPLQEITLHQTSSTLHTTIMKCPAVNRAFNTSVPAFLLLGKQLSELEDKVAEVLNDERVTTLKRKPLILEELGCLETDPQKGIGAELEKWYFSSYPLCRERAKLIKEALEKEKKRKQKK